MKSLHFSTEGKYSETVSALAISYLRWSSAIQGAGATRSRQSKATDAWLAAHSHVRLAQELVDAGVSAFKGKNVKNGAFGAFLAAVQEGRIPKGTYLLVESLDRISRLTPEEALAIFLQIINAGIIIVTLMDGQEYRSGQKDMMMVLFKSIMIMAQAHEEVLKRSYRIKDSWEDRTKKARASGKPIPGNLPAWLWYDAEGNLQIEERKAEVVRKIFDMAISGLGLNATAAFLNEGNVELITLHKRKNIKNRSDFWTVTTVANILRYRAVYGDYHPKKNGEPIYGIFPVIVSKEDFHRAEAARSNRATLARGRNGKHFHNLFKGVAKCHQCGEAMNIKNGRNKLQPNKALQLRCSGVGVKTCMAKPWNYDVFEAAFMMFVNEIDLPAIMNGGSESKADKITQELQALKGERLNLQKVEESYMDAIDKDGDMEPIYRERIKNNRKKIDGISERMKALEADRNRVQAEQRASNELLPIELPKDARVRAKIAEHIRTIVESVTLYRNEPFGSYFTVKFAGGGSRRVNVDYTDRKKPVAIILDLGEGVSNDVPHNVTELMESVIKLM